MILVLRLLLVAAIACCATAASAQTMYRCGSTYQDHPCGGGQQGQVIGTSPVPGAASSSPASPGHSAQCVQRGIAAQKIKWMREAGKTQEEQVATAGWGQAGLIADVYGRHGTSMEVRAAVEQDCMDEQERAAQAAALIDAANRLKAGHGSVESRFDTQGNGGAAAAPNTAPLSTGADAASTEAANKKATCQGLTRQLDDVRARERAGSTLQGMEAMRQQYRDIGDKIHAAGC